MDKSAAIKELAEKINHIDLDKGGVASYEELAEKAFDYFEDRYQEAISELENVIADKKKLIYDNARLREALLQIEQYTDPGRSGIELIAEERKRQIEVEGWTARHDAKHCEGELAIAGARYAIYNADNVQLLDFKFRDAWPFEDEWWKPDNDPIRNLVKAGALIAAEIDRLQNSTQ